VGTYWAPTFVSIGRGRKYGFVMEFKY